MPKLKKNIPLSSGVKLICRHRNTSSKPPTRVFRCGDWNVENDCWFGDWNDCWFIDWNDCWFADENDDDDDDEPPDWNFAELTFGIYCWFGR